MLLFYNKLFITFFFTNNKTVSSGFIWSFNVDWSISQSLSSPKARNMEWEVFSRLIESVGTLGFATSLWSSLSTTALKNHNATTCRMTFLLFYFKGAYVTGNYPHCFNKNNREAWLPDWCRLRPVHAVYLFFLFYYCCCFDFSYFCISIFLTAFCNTAGH